MLAVLAVLVTAVRPGMQALVADGRRAAQVNTLAGLLQHARQASIQRRRPVAVCPSADGVRCSRDWQDGTLVFFVRPGWRDTQPVAADDVLARSDATAKPLWAGANRNRFTFRPYRRRSTNGTLVVCAPGRRGQGRAIVVAPTGRVRTTDRIPGWAEPHCR